MIYQRLPSIPPRSTQRDMPSRTDLPECGPLSTPWSLPPLRLIWGERVCLVALCLKRMNRLQEVSLFELLFSIEMLGFASALSSVLCSVVGFFV